MNHMDTPNPKDDVFYQVEKQVKTGKRIITSIVVLGFICLGLNLISSITTGNFGLPAFIIFVLGVIIYVNLYAGRIWAKRFFVAFSCIDSLIKAYNLLSSLNLGLHLDTAMWISYLASIVYSVCMIVLLLASKSVKEYLSHQISA